MKNDETCAVASRPATVWASLGLMAELVALQMVVALDCNDGPVPGRLDAVIDLIALRTVRGRERQNIRRAAQKAREAGLVFEHEGLVYILYSETQWRRHGALGEQVASEERL